MAPRDPKKGRRTKGAGSIYTTPEGFMAQLEIDGKLIRRRAPDRKAARTVLAELIALRDQRIDIHSGRQTLTAWLNVWYRHVAEQRGLKPRTLEHYRDQIEHYILPELGDIALDDLRAGHIQDWAIKLRQDIQARSVKRNQPHDGARTVQAAAAVLRQALKLAVARRLIPFNPMADDAVILPTHVPEPGRPLTDEELGKLLFKAATHRLAGLWFAYALLGLRRGEGLGLEWSGLDKEAGTLTVFQQVHLEGNRPVEAETKTRAGGRVLPISPFLAELLERQWAVQAKWRKKYQTDFKEHGLIFCSRYGTPIWPRNESHYFTELCADAGLPDDIHLHDLRHTVTTLLDECGATEGLKAGILGHAKQATATQVYTHARLAAMRKVLEEVERRVMRAYDKAAQDAADEQAAGGAV